MLNVFVELKDCAVKIVVKHKENRNPSPAIFLHECLCGTDLFSVLSEKLRKAVHGY